MKLSKRHMRRESLYWPAMSSVAFANSAVTVIFLVKGNGELPISKCSFCLLIEACMAFILFSRLIMQLEVFHK